MKKYRDVFIITKNIYLSIVNFHIKLFKQVLLSTSNLQLIKKL